MFIFNSNDILIKKLKLKLESETFILEPIWSKHYIVSELICIYVCNVCYFSFMHFTPYNLYFKFCTNLKLETFKYLKL